MTCTGELGSPATGSVWNKPRQEASFCSLSSHPYWRVLCVCVCECYAQRLFNFLAIGHADLWRAIDLLSCLIVSHCLPLNIAISCPGCPRQQQQQRRHSLVDRKHIANDMANYDVHEHTPFGNCETKVCIHVHVKNWTTKMSSVSQSSHTSNYTK